jgi:hypothetical protein
MLMFDKQDQPPLFTLSNRRRNAGWDIEFIIPDYQVGRKYSFRARIDFKGFISGEDAIQE